MKKLELPGNAARIAAALCVAAIGLVPFVSCDKYDDTEIREQITDINDRLTALEENMDAQLAALRAIVDDKTTILSCLYNEETGMYTITLTDDQNTVIEIPAVGNDMVPVISYIEEDGVKYWATVSEGGVKTAITDAEGNRISMDGDKPALKLGDNGEWMVSVDGSTWTGLGITSENAAIFAKAEETDTSVIFTLADGTELEVLKYDESQAAFYPLVGKQFFTAGETRTVEFALEGIVNIGVMEVPAGWSAKTSKTTLTATAPAADDTDAELSGVIKILGVTSDGKSFISEVYVEVGTPELGITVSADKTVDIEILVELEGKDLIYGVMPTSEYSPEKIVAGLSDGSIQAIYTQEAVSATLSEILGSEPQDGVSYTVWAVITSWEGYTADDVYSASYQPVSASIDVTDIGFDTMSISVTVSGTSSFVPGFFIKSEGGRTLEQVLADYVAYGSEFVIETGSYNGLLINYGAYGDVPVSAGSDYVIYALPLVEGKAAEEYTVDDFICEEASTPSLQPGGSVNVELTDINLTMASVSASIMADGAYKVYGAYMPKADYEALADDAAIVADLTASFPLWQPYSVSQSNLNPGTEGYIVAVAIDKDGKYGTVAKTEANTRTLTWSETMTMTIGTPEAGLTSVSIPYEVEGGEVTRLKYLNLPEEDFNANAPFMGWAADLSVMEQYLATVDYDQYGGLQYGVTIIPDNFGSTSIPVDNVINIEWLQTGKKYVFYLIAEDESGYPVHGVECTYTPGLPQDKIMRSNSPDYEFGRPELNLVSSVKEGSSDFYTFTFDVTAGADCKEYYITTLEESQFADWRNGFYYVLSNGVPYEGNQTSVSVEWVMAEAYIGLVWVDSNDMYHETYLIPASELISSGGE